MAGLWVYNVSQYQQARQHTYNIQTVSFFTLIISPVSVYLNISSRASQQDYIRSQLRIISNTSNQSLLKFCYTSTAHIFSINSRRSSCRTSLELSSQNTCLRTSGQQDRSLHNLSCRTWYDGYTAKHVKSNSPHWRSFPKPHRCPLSKPKETSQDQIPQMLKKKALDYQIYCARTN